MDRKLYCRKNQLFYQRTHTLDYLKNHCKNNEVTFLENAFLFGFLFKINGFIRREKQLKTKDEVVKYFVKVFSTELRGERIMHKYIDDIRYIVSLYD